jgi:DNA-binding transcriptional LysR family regulator
MARDLNVDQIKKLWILDLVIQQGSLKKAALQAKVSPSAISQTLTSLEKSFGKPLLIREKGAVSPTQDALSILEVVRPAFAAFDRLRDLSGTPAPQISWMNFGTYESIAIDILPGLLHSLRQKLPNLRLGLRISRTSNLLTMVRKGELCSALIAEVDHLDRFYVKQVGEDRLGLYVSKKYEIANLGWSALEKYGFGSLAAGKDGLPRYYTKFLRRNDLAKPAIVSDSFEALRAAAASGSIVAVLPNRVAKRVDDLQELTPSGSSSKSLNDSGQHKIFVVSQTSCDRVETDFVAEETRRILGG